MAINKENSSILTTTAGGLRDGLCDGQGDGLCDKSRKYYNKYNKKNKNNKNNVIIPSVESLSAKSQKTEGSPLEKNNNNLKEKKKEKDVSHANPDWITKEEVIKATVQLYKNPRTRKSKERHILKLQIESKIEGYIDYIATLTTSASSLARFGNTISKKNKELVLEVAQRMKTLIKAKHPRSKVYIGKFRETSGDLFVEGSKGNMPIEEATIGVVWYDTIEHNWQFYIFFQEWDHGGRFETGGLTQKQIDTNMTGMYIYYPELKIKKLSRTERRRQKRLNNEKQT